jgi:hypothetical protein
VYAAYFIAFNIFVCLLSSFAIFHQPSPSLEIMLELGARHEH